MTQETAILYREWGLAVPVLLLLMAPGFGPALWFAKRGELSVPWVVSLAFAWSAAWSAIVAISMFYLGLSIHWVMWATLAAVPFSGWVVYRVWRRRKESSRIRWGLSGLGVAFAAWIAALIEQPWWFGTPDTYYHIAASRSLLATGRPIVTDPFFGTDSALPDSTAGMWNTVQAVVGLVARSDLATVYPALTAFSAFAVMLAFWVMAREASKSDLAATIASAGYFVFAWYTDFRGFGYPNKVSLAFAFITVALVIRYADKLERKYIFAAGVSGAATLAVHLASGQLTLLLCAGIMVCLAVTALFHGDAKERRYTQLSSIAVLVALGLMIALVAPTLVPRVAALRGSSVIGDESFIWAGEQILKYPWGIRIVTPGGFDFGGPWLFWLTFAIGVLAIAHVVRTGDRRTASVLPLIGLAHVLTVFPLVSSPLLHFSSYMAARMVELLRFSPYVAVAWALGELPAGKSRLTVRALAAGLLVAAAVTQWPFLHSTYVQDAGEQRRGHIYSFSESKARDMRKEYGFSEIFEMRRIVGDDYPLVAADPDTAYYLMGLMQVAVVPSLPSHTPVFMDRAEVQQRYDDMRKFFMTEATREQRIDTLERYRPDYVFVRLALNGRVVYHELADDTELFETLVRNDNILFLKVNQDALDRLAARRALERGASQ